MATGVSNRRGVPGPSASPRDAGVRVDYDDAAAVIKAVKRGLSYNAVTTLQEKSGFSLEQISDIIRTPLRTLARRKKAGRLTSDESERLMRLEIAFSKTLELFDGSQDAAQHWLSSPAKAFGGETPLAMLQTEFGAREVEDLIGRLEHGVFS